MSAVLSTPPQSPTRGPVNARRRRLPLARMSRSLAVSLCTTALSATILALLNFTRMTSATHANIAATVAGIGPLYLLNRRWAWKCTTRSSVVREVAPFWAMSLFALVASTWSVAHADIWATGHEFGSATRTAIVIAANLVTFASLWIAQFALLDRVLFTSNDHREPLA